MHTFEKMGVAYPLEVRAVEGCSFRGIHEVRTQRHGLCSGEMAIVDRNFHGVLTLWSTSNQGGFSYPYDL